MNKNRKIIGILQIILVLSLGTTAIAYVLDDGYEPRGDGKVTVVASINQSKAQTPKWVETATIDVADLGINLALGKPVTSSGFRDEFDHQNVNDGKTETYWEGNANAYPNIITIDLSAPQNVQKIRVRLNPDKIWGKRVENFSVLSSMDGKNFKEAVSAKDYQFDPQYGNMATVEFDKAVNTQFVQLQFYKNTGSNSAQVAEFEIYGVK